MSSDNVVIDIDSISIETLSTPETTYNFEVADYHTYYVCESGVLVHNRCETIGKSHGASEHRAEIDSQANILQASGEYDKIYLNRSLKSAGVNDMGIRPDIIAIRNDGSYYIIEVASKSQASGKGLRLLQGKMYEMEKIPNVTSKLIHYRDYTILGG